MNQTICEILLLGLITDRDRFRGTVSAIPPSILKKRKKQKKKVKNKNYKVKNKVLIFFFLPFVGSIFWPFLVLFIDPCPF
jgi:hypothetical protein